MTEAPWQINSVGLDAPRICCDLRAPSRVYTLTHTTGQKSPPEKSNKHLFGKGFGPLKGEKETQKVSKQFSKDAFNPLASPCVCFPLQNVSNYCGTPGIWIHRQWIPLRLLPDIWDQSGLRTLVRLLRACWQPDRRGVLVSWNLRVLGLIPGGEREGEERDRGRREQSGEGETEGEEGEEGSGRSFLTAPFPSNIL